MHNQPIEGDLKNILAKAKDIRVAMFTSVDESGALHSRPMSTVAVDEEGCLWFFTKDHTEKTEEVNTHAQVNLAYSRPEDHTYLSLSGTASVSHDKQKMQELWNPMLKAWFPNGPEEPGMALLRVQVQGAELWDSNASRMVQLYRMAKAIVSGQEYEYKPEEHQRAGNL